MASTTSPVRMAAGELQLITPKAIGSTPAEIAAPMFDRSSLITNRLRRATTVTAGALYSQWRVIITPRIAVIVGVAISLIGWLAHFPRGRVNTSYAKAAISGNRIRDVPVVSTARPIPPTKATARNSANNLVVYFIIV